MCLNKQDPEHALDPKYVKILNIAKFRIWQGSQYPIEFSICATQRSGYASEILYKAGF